VLVNHTTTLQHKKLKQQLRKILTDTKLNLMNLKPRLAAIQSGNRPDLCVVKIKNLLTQSLTNE